MSFCNRDAPHIWLKGEKPMNEMKPEDVMRALECCLDFECTECPMNYEDCEEREFEYLVRQSLPMLKALIREKDAEIKELTDDNKWSAKRIIETDKLVSLLKAENERLTKERDEARSDCAVAEQNHYECKEELETARADAITEFAERLKQCTECMGECTVDNPLAETYSVVREEYIEEIAKELKGETDGKSDL
jgi:exonuclease VII large subunit